MTLERATVCCHSVREDLPELSEDLQKATLRALSRVYAAGVLHGEASPSNVLLPVSGGLPKWAHSESFIFSTDREAHEIEIATIMQELAVLRAIRKAVRAPQQSPGTFAMACWRTCLQPCFQVSA